MSRSTSIVRHVGLSVTLCGLLVLLLAFWAPAATATPSPSPGAIADLASTTHPDETTWYAGNQPAFAWGALSGVAGYSYALDQNPMLDGLDTTVDAVTTGLSDPVGYASGDYDTGLAVADIDDDGHDDIVATGPSADAVDVLTGNADGTFDTAVTYPTHHGLYGPYGVAVGDINGDGWQDIVVCLEDYPSGTIDVLLNDGSGGFEPAVSYTTGGGYPYFLAVGDLDGDGCADVAVTNNYYWQSNLSVFMGNADGTLSGRQDYSMGAYPNGRDPLGVVIGDFNDDHSPDIAVAVYNEGANSVVRVLLNDGTGAFPTWHDTSVGDGAYGLTAADLNDDGHLDLAVTQYGLNSVGVLLGSGDGTFQADRSYATQPYPCGVAAADVTGDGILDLIVASACNRGASVFPGTGDGTFGDRTDLTASNYPLSVGAADFNGDGGTDVVVGGWVGGVQVLLSKPPTVSLRPVPDGTWYFHVRAVDGEGDGGPVATRTVLIDTTPPDVALSGVADGGTYSSEQQAVLTATDPVPGPKRVSGKLTAQTASRGCSGVADVQWRLQGDSDWTTVDGDTATIDIPAGSGTVTYEYRAADSASPVAGSDGGSNVSDLQSFTVTVEDSGSGAPPVITAKGADDLWHRLPVTVRLGATDPDSAVDRVEYRKGAAGAWVAVEGAAAKVRVAAGGIHTYQYRAVDTDGNVSAIGRFTVRIDKVAPTVALGSAVSTAQGSIASLPFRLADDMVRRLHVHVFVTQYHHQVAVVDLGQRTVGQVVAAVRCTMRPGAYGWKVSATDAAGNTGWSGSRRLVVSPGHRR